MNWTEFINAILKVIKKILERKQEEPKIELLTMPSSDVQGEISLAGLRLLYPGLLDSKYCYTRAEDWAEIFSYIYFVFDMPKYLVDRMDCDDFAVLLKGLVTSFFGLNCFGVVYGNTPMGYHSWNVFRTEETWLQFEPQTGEFFKMNKRDYKPEWILI